MLRVVFLLASVALVLGYDREVWHSGCGKSKFPDAFMDRNFNQSLWNPHIVGGKETRRHEGPWQIQLQHFGSLSCGGSLLKESWVITAAHCVQGRSAENLQVVVGDHKRSESSTENPRKKTHQVASVTIHPDYNQAARFDADIALLRLTEPAEFNEDVLPICAPNPAPMPVEDYLNETITVTGWGAVYRFGPVSDTLMYTDHSPVQTNQACQTRFGARGTITDGMLCAGRIEERERDTCQGDSGGPLLTARGEGDNRRFELVGLTSWGIGCAAGYPGVYTRVAQYHAWVTSIIN